MTLNERIIGSAATPATVLALYLSRPAAALPPRTTLARPQKCQSRNPYFFEHVLNASGSISGASLQSWRGDRYTPPRPQPRAVHRSSVRSVPRPRRRTRTRKRPHVLIPPATACKLALLPTTQLPLAINPASPASRAYVRSYALLARFVWATRSPQSPLRLSCAPLS